MKPYIETTQYSFLPKNVKVYRVENAPIDGIDGQGYLGEGQEAEWYFSFTHGDGIAKVYAWVFLAEQAEAVELVVDERDHLSAGVQAYFAKVGRSAITQAAYVREHLPALIQQWRELRADAAA